MSSGRSFMGISYSIKANSLAQLPYIRTHALSGASLSLAHRTRLSRLQRVAKGGAGAEETGLYRPDWHIDDLGDLLIVTVLHIAKDDHRAELGVEGVERFDEALMIHSHAGFFSRVQLRILGQPAAQTGGL